MQSIPDTSSRPADLDRLLVEIRPNCIATARACRLGVDGEDLLQDALIKQWNRFDQRPDRQSEGWLFGSRTTRAGFLAPAATGRSSPIWRDVDMIADPFDGRRQPPDASTAFAPS